MSYINRYKEPLFEGELRCAALAKYMERLNVPKIVWLSEDGSGIVPRISYHSPSNQLVGLVLPFDATGMPITNSFVVRTAVDITQQMEKPKSTHVYIVVAQPIVVGVPPFILQFFGTDNTFTTQNLLDRWTHTREELAKYAQLLIVDIFF